MRSSKNDQMFDRYPLLLHSPLPHHPQRRTIDLLFKNNRIRKLDKFQDPASHLPSVWTS